MSYFVGSATADLFITDLTMDGATELEATLREAGFTDIRVVDVAKVASQDPALTVNRYTLRIHMDGFYQLVATWLSALHAWDLGGRKGPIHR